MSFDASPRLFCAVRGREGRHSATHSGPNVKPTLFALALGTFAIGSGELGSNGIIALLSDDLNVFLPLTTYEVTAYAFGRHCSP